MRRRRRTNNRGQTADYFLLYLPFAVIGAALSVLTCLSDGRTGWLLALLLVVLFLAYFLAAQAAFILLVCFYTLFVDMEKPQRTRSTFALRLTAWCLGLVCGFFRLRIHVSGEEQIPAGRFLLVENHRADFDPLVTTWALRKYDLAFISKPENLRLPCVGRMMHRCCYLGIDRDNDREALRTILEAADRMKNDVISYCIYPEGTRNKGEGLLPFRNGAFKIAQRAKAPIVAVAVSYSGSMWRNFPLRRTDVYLRVCRVIPAEEVQELKTAEIGELVRESILAALG